MESFQEGFLQFADADLSDRTLACGAFTFVAFFILPLFTTVILGSLIRWPFWKSWTVCFRNTLWRPTTMTGDWSDDRMTHRSGRKSYTPFCAAVPGRPGMHRLLTGRSLFDRNPGWRAPWQVIIITAEGSFPLPVADEKERQRVIRTINEFTVLSTREMLARSHRVQEPEVKRSETSG